MCGNEFSTLLGEKAAGEQQQHTNTQRYKMRRLNVCYATPQRCACVFVCVCEHKDEPQCCQMLTAIAVAVNRNGNSAEFGSNAKQAEGETNAKQQQLQIQQQISCWLEEKMPDKCNE